MKRRAFLRNSGLTGAVLMLNPWLLIRCKNDNSPEALNVAPAPSEREMPLLILEGTPRQRGRIHGETLRERINELVGGLTEGIRKAGKDPLDYAGRIVDGAGFLDAALRWTPHCVEEIRGIAEGAGIDFKIMFAFNLLDESDWFFQGNNWVNPDYKDNSRCSVLGTDREAGHPAILAQNADMGPAVDGYQTLLHIKHADSDLEELILTLPGVMGIYGMNNRSIGVCLNAMTMSLNKSPDGLGTIFISRGILHQKNLGDAIAFITEVKHASGEAYTFGDKERIVCFEGSADKVTQFIPYPGAKRVYHTNHPLVNDDVWLSPDNPDKTAPQLREGFAIGIENSKTRLQALEKRLKDASQSVTVDSIKSILCSHDSPEYPVCRHDERGNITTFSMIMVLKDSPVLQAAPGPPCKTEFKTYKF
ncbi:MAG: hypothetical protein JXB23_01705 [Candidatus Aminicenantes bacterium]|nr:hypothetical protein [Candidatus Aminicenantes bacterium]